MKHHKLRLGRLVLWPLLCFAAPLAAADPEGSLPRWFEANRVQAHFENSIQDDLSGLYRELHPAIRTMGADVLTRIFKTTAEGAWWPTAAGHTHELLGGRDLGREIADDAHRHGLKVIAYYRIMCDDFVEREHPQWLCRDAAGNLVLEPRTRRRPKEEDRKHVICFNSPARELVRTRLLELADRGVDGIYFDSWHMPEVCTCDNCRAAYRRETGEAMQVTAERDTPEYRRNADFVARSIVRNFSQWKQAVRQKHPDVLFAIGSSLYPCFDKQMQITAELLRISDTSKTEFSKPLGGFLGWPTSDMGASPNRQRPYLDASFAVPAYDLQNALGWSLTRDSCQGRPPLMWIPDTRTQQEAMFSTAAAVSYGCVASLHPTGLWSRRSPTINLEATRMYEACYALGDRVSPWLATTRPHRFALIHISQRSRDARIADPRALWVEFFAPVLGAFEALKEEHVPVATINDLQLEQELPSETRVVILPHGEEITGAQRSVLNRFEAAGGTVLRLDTDRGWHLKNEKPGLQQQLLARMAAQAAPPPLQARGPAGMHAVFFRDPTQRKTVVCLVNQFGWFHCEREPSPTTDQPAAPPACRNVTIELSASEPPVHRALEAVGGKELVVRHANGNTTIDIPDFPIMACVVFEQDLPDEEAK